MSEVEHVMMRLGGVATRADLLAAGISEPKLRRALRNGTLTTVRRGAYALAGTSVEHSGNGRREYLLTAATAVRQAGSQAAASHQTAAVIHGIELVGKPPVRTTVTRPAISTRGRSARAGVLLHYAQLPLDQVTEVHGVRTTTPARTVIDLARALPFQQGVVAADSALRKRLTTRGELRAVAAACTGWPGVRRAQHVAEFADHRAESALESIARAVFDEYGLPPPDLQVWVGGESPVGRADFLWAEHRTIAEADGAAKYDQRGAAMAQLRRDAELRAAGFEVVHFGWHVINVAPWQVIEAIRAAFARGDGAIAREGR